MKKIFKFIYPYTYLHLKWFHRLVLVLVIFGSLFFGVILAIELKNNALPFESFYASVKIKKWQTERQVFCSREVYSWTSTYYCRDDEKVFDFIKDTDWAKQSFIPIQINTQRVSTLPGVRFTLERKDVVYTLSSQNTLSMLINENPELKGEKSSSGLFFFRNKQSSELVGDIVSILEKEGIIKRYYEYKINIRNIILVILVGIGISLGFFALFFALIYRIILYIIYGSKLGKQK